MSSTGAEWVSSPTAMKSTPVSPTARATSTVSPPLASRTTPGAGVERFFERLE